MRINSNRPELRKILSISDFSTTSSFLKNTPASSIALLKSLILICCNFSYSCRTGSGAGMTSTRSLSISHWISSAFSSPAMELLLLLADKFLFRFFSASRSWMDSRFISCNAYRGLRVFIRSTRPTSYCESSVGNSYRQTGHVHEWFASQSTIQCAW